MKENPLDSCLPRVKPNSAPPLLGVPSAFPLPCCSATCTAKLEVGTAERESKALQAAAEGGGGEAVPRALGPSGLTSNRSRKMEAQMQAASLKRWSRSFALLGQHLQAHAGQGHAGNGTYFLASPIWPRPGGLLGPRRRGADAGREEARAALRGPARPRAAIRAGKEVAKVALTPL